MFSQRTVCGRKERFSAVDRRSAASAVPFWPDDDTKAGLYEIVQKGLKRFDDRQEEIGVQIPDGPQQIPRDRGIRKDRTAGTQGGCHARETSRLEDRGIV